MPLKLVLNRCVSMGLVLLSGVAPATIAWSQFNATESVIDNDLIFQEQNGVVAVEAEHFVSQNAEGPRQWHITTHDHTPSVAADGDPNHAATASGGAYIELLPDTRRTHGDKLIPGKNFQPQPGPIGAINYRIQFNNAGRYYVWVRAFSGGSEDNGIHVGLNGKWPKSGQRMQWCEGKHAWRWESKQRTKDQHCGVPGNIFLDIDKPGTHTVSFCMREDGFEFDRFLLTKDKNFVRPADAGPATRTTTGATPPSFAAQPQPDGNGEVTISGELKTWHKITLDLDGPFAREVGAKKNPFLDYRFSCEFTHVGNAADDHSETTYNVPGYFAADGDAAETSSTAGTTWRCQFTPDRPGTWKYRVTFFTGSKVAIDSCGAVKVVDGYHGQSGEFQVEPTNKTGNDFRARGNLRYVGQRYLREAETKRWFFKAGPDAPETLLAFKDFDNTISRKGKAAPVKHWRPHVGDWNVGDPTWQSGKGKGLIGAINYLSSKGLNAISCLTYNVGGDGHNVWPHVSDTKSDRLRFDCSKLDQWGIVFEHAQSKGLMVHIKLQETENDDFNIGHDGETKKLPAPLDGGNLYVERKLYLRELIARFGHLPALEWNIGEENTQSARQQNEMANFIAATDAYDHPIVLHTFPQEQDKRFEPMLGKGSRLTGASLQNMWDAVHRRTLRWVKASKDSGRPWVCANDEQGAADQGVPPDPGYGGFDGAVTMKGGRKYDLHDIRKRTLWGNLMAGGGGVMYYFGYKLKQNDLRCQDFRSRDRSWDYCRHALNFLHEQNLPLAQMTNMNALVGNPNNQYGPWCLAEPNQVYLVYVPAGGKAELDLSDATGVYSLAHFNPREGGPLKMSAQTVAGGTKLTLAAPASGPEEDWVFLVQRTKRGGGGMNQHQLGNRSSAKH